MVFSSIPFLFFFLPLCLILYYAVPERWKNLVLLVFSLVFYAWGEPVFILLMLASCTFNWAFCLWMEKTSDRPRRKLLLIVSVIGNLATLAFFKYANLLLSTLGLIPGLSLPVLRIALPVGISFYTFQAMSCVVDVYRGDVRAERSLPYFITYISMFPQLIAGPIVRYTDVADALNGDRHIDFVGGVLRFTAGLVKKVLLANAMGALWDEVQGAFGTSVTLSPAVAWLGVCAFTLQIYFDFSGYSDMAIGMGFMLGFRFPENFQWPYISQSITEFWRRWHITLSLWFRSYVYIPLGGNRVSKWKHIRNLLIVWGLSGFWHGAAWNFLLWGLYYGILLTCEKYLWGKALEKAPRFIRHLYTLFLVVVGFTIFSFDDFAVLGQYLQTMFGFGALHAEGISVLYLLRTYAVPLAAAVLFSTPIAPVLHERFRASRLRPVYSVLRVLVYTALLVLCTASLVSDTFNPFLYFRF